MWSLVARYRNESRLAARRFADALGLGQMSDAVVRLNRAEAERLSEISGSRTRYDRFLPAEAGWEAGKITPLLPERLSMPLRPFALLTEFGSDTAFYRHFRSVCMCYRLESADQRTGIRHFRAFFDGAADLVVALGGKLSGERGDRRGALLERMHGPELITPFSNGSATSRFSSC